MQNPPPSQTLRPTIPAIDEILGKEFPVLDHGFVRVVDYMGGDAAVVQAARVSYGTGTKKVTQDRGLIRYLMRHRHTTPFEMCEIKFHVKLPIFVARQWIRHRTASVNEYSARYSILDKEFYIPDRTYIETALAHEKHTKQSARANDAGQQSLFEQEIDRPSLEATAVQSTSNKQGRGSLLDEDEATEALKAISRVSASAYSAYAKLLNEDGHANRVGIARELARIVLPTNYYTQWYWKTDLHNLLHFLSLRADSHAQAEIRAYAQVICSIVEKWTPHTWEAFNDYRLHSVNLSSTELSLLKKMLAGEAIDRSNSGLTEREWNEFGDKFGAGN
ncbi:MAG: FAD-dependent thymidylate synthase [Candidatus Accumulibacter cognatus]|uniref:Flavin-dependent thymidylate synthase n=1 Tax=Candidatus Accumulibacter cognatus TaxID=2954383 RepID=A0A7D5NAV1_9PROT|nr:MAG: FAD-dependent thymidylate synthase [Candidatus Accumulibacter cognatus]